MPIFHPIFRHLSYHVYSAFLPASDPSIYGGAREYFIDIQNRAPLKAKAVHFLLAVFIYLSPMILLLSWKPLPFISKSKKALVFSRLMHSRLFLFRTAFYGARGTAYVAILRDPKAREYFRLKL